MISCLIECLLLLWTRQNYVFSPSFSSLLSIFLLLPSLFLYPTIFHILLPLLGLKTCLCVPPADQQGEWAGQLWGQGWGRGWCWRDTLRQALVCQCSQADSPALHWPGVSVDQSCAVIPAATVAAWSRWSMRDEASRQKQNGRLRVTTN